MVFRKIRVLIVLVGILTFSFCAVEGVRAQIQSTTSDMVDPETPTSRYVLDKLNKHIGDYQSNQAQQFQETKTTLETVSSLQKEDLKTQVAVLTDKVDTQGWLLKSLLAGMATLLGKEITDLVKSRKSK